MAMSRVLTVARGNHSLALRARIGPFAAARALNNGSIPTLRDGKAPKMSEYFYALDRSDLLHMLIATLLIGDAHETPALGNHARDVSQPRGS